MELKFPKLNSIIVHLVLKQLSKYCLKYLYFSEGSQLHLMGLIIGVLIIEVSNIGVVTAGVLTVGVLTIGILTIGILIWDFDHWGFDRILVQLTHDRWPA